MPATNTAKKHTSLPKKSKTAPLPLQIDAAPRARRLRLPPYRPFRLKRIKHPVKLPSAWAISKKTLSLLWRRRWLFLSIAVVYGVLSILFVTGLSGGVDVTNLKQQVAQGLGGHIGQLGVGLSVFTQLLTSAGNGAGAAAGAYQVFLGLIISLATIWALRQTAAGGRIRLRDAFYKGMYPLIPFIVVLAVVLLQTVPFLIGGGLYSLAVNFGIAVSTLEKILWGLLFLVLAIISAYMLCSSLFALYVVTLPDMTPLKALRSARQLVRYRRGSVFRKLLFLFIALFVVAIAIMLPIILVAAVLAQWVFLLLSVVGLVVIHGYMYTLYRELLE